MTCNRIISTFHTFLNAAAKNSVRPSEGVAGGGGWGEEFRHARANKISSQPRRPARQSRTPQKSFVFLLEEKIGRAQKGNRKQNFSVVWRESASGGGAASSLGILRKMGSYFFKQTPPKFICRLFRLGATRLGGHFVQEIPGGFEIDGQLSRRKAAVPKQSLDCAFSARADGSKIFINCRSNEAIPFNRAI